MILDFFPISDSGWLNTILVSIIGFFGVAFFKEVKTNFKRIFEKFDDIVLKKEFEIERDKLSDVKKRVQKLEDYQELCPNCPKPPKYK